MCLTGQYAPVAGCFREVVYRSRVYMQLIYDWAARPTSLLGSSVNTQIIYVYIVGNHPAVGSQPAVAVLDCYCVHAYPPAESTCSRSIWMRGGVGSDKLGVFS